MLTEKIDSNIIHIYQKVIDKTTLIRFTADFIMKVFALFYKKQYSNAQGNESAKIINSIQATLYGKINQYVKDTAIRENNIIDIKFEKDNAIPVVSLHHDVKESDILLNVFFKKVSWDEINEFRVFLVRFLKYYLLNYHQKSFKDEHAVSKTVSDLSYIIQELLQNANSYSYGSYDYELVLRHSDNHFYITVSNFAHPDNFKKLEEIVVEIQSSANLNELVLKYMLNEEKHLGIISSIYNYNLKTFKMDFVENKIVSINCSLDY